MGAPVFSTEKRRGWISFSCRALRFVPSTQSPELDAARIRLQARRGGGISMLDTTSSLAVMLCGWEIDCSAFPQRNSWFGRPQVTILKKNETAPGDPEAASYRFCSAKAGRIQFRVFAYTLIACRSGCYPLLGFRGPDGLLRLFRL